MAVNLKEGVKILGLACSSFDRVADKEVWLNGVVVRGATIIEGVMRTKITVDGEDATQQIIQMTMKSTHFNQLKMIMTKGVTVAGFNYIDIKQLHEKTNLPVIVIIDHQPDLEEIRTAIQHVSNWEKRFALVQEAENLREVRTNPEEEPIFVQSIGYDEKQLDTFLQKITIVGRIPEPIRIARLLAIAEIY